MTPANLQAEWARLLVESLAASGVTDAVISPGARSLPLVLAAHRSSRLRCHDLVDERVAGFFALGQARVTGRPSLLLCTSGTAAAHYLPAVIEAAMSGTPMLVLGADRPPELHDAGSPQTIDQQRLFGTHVRWFRDLGVPDAAPVALRALRRVAAQAVLATTWPVPGPAHLNAPLRKPLEPPATLGDNERFLADDVTVLLAQGPPHAYPPRPAPDEVPLGELIAACRGARRGLIVCGAAPISQARARPAIEALGAATRFPILAEAPSQLRFIGRRPSGAPRCDGFDLLLPGGFGARHAPDLVLQFGQAPLSRALDAYLDAHACPRWVIASTGWHDPGDRAARFLWGDLAEIARAIATAIDRREPGGEWERAFSDGDARVWAAIAAELSAGGLSEGQVAKALCESLPERSLLVLGNSLPVRHADLYCRGDLADAAVLAQRGANGIDGLVSGASGAASVHEGPVALLVGDVSFLHDHGGLAAARAAERPLVIAVLNNDGGRLFEQLPVGHRADLREPFERHLVMPQRVDLAAAAAVFGIPFSRAATPHDLRIALAAALKRHGCTVIEAVVPPHDAAERMKRILAAVHG
jgi:2-succinyl-5-enolpyruvyl-6-hydroxy-3-cyclohexene-1-carboxylate synthase